VERVSVRLRVSSLFNFLLIELKTMVSPSALMTTQTRGEDLAISSGFIGLDEWVLKMFPFDFALSNKRIAIHDLSLSKQTLFTKEKTYKQRFFTVVKS